MTASDLPMAGTIVAQVLDVSPLALHGDRYIDITLLPESGSNRQPHRVRIPADVFDRPPRAGDRVRLTVLLQQVTAASFLP